MKINKTKKNVDIQCQTYEIPEILEHMKKINKNKILENVQQFRFSNKWTQYTCYNANQLIYIYENYDMDKS